MAIGARVKLIAGGMTQTDEVHSGGSYLSQSDTRLHFGLGSAKKIDRVEIRWPSGQTETLTDLASNQFYSVLEGSGIVPASRIRPVGCLCELAEEITLVCRWAIFVFGTVADCQFAGVIDVVPLKLRD